LCTSSSFCLAALSPVSAFFCNLAALIQSSLAAVQEGLKIGSPFLSNSIGFTIISFIYFASLYYRILIILYRKAPQK